MAERAPTQSARASAQARTIARPRELVLASLAGVALAVLMTWPLAAGFGHLGRTLGADGQFSIWNVSWVARTLAVDPLHVYDANIFFPHRTTLAYSEANLLEGAIAMPVYWPTRNPYAALNFVVLFSFATSFLCMYLLVRYLTGDARAGTVSGVLYACCPYVFAHTSHIQLLMTGGLPLAMLMLHRVVDRPAAARGVHLGLALVAQALSCAYYGVFAALMVAFGTLVLAWTRGLWRSREYWTAIALGAIVPIAVVVPFFLPYLRVQAESGFARTLEDAARWSANPQSYLASSAHAHGFLLAAISRYDRWSEVLFPGILATVLGLAGLGVRPGSDRGQTPVYASLGVLALWASFGPSAGLYRVLFHLPLFSFLRAPSRFGLVVVLVLAVFAGSAVHAILDRLRPERRTIGAAVLVLLAIAELNVLPFPWERAPVTPAPYAVLARLPRAVVAEFPFYGERIAFPLHAQYMLFSTSHWMPLVNGYSDVIPADFRETAAVLDSFPSADTFGILARHRVRYIGVHWDMYGPRADGVRRAMDAYAPYLRVLASDPKMTLYEVVRYP